MKSTLQEGLMKSVMWIEHGLKQGATTANILLNKRKGRYPKIVRRGSFLLVAIRALRERLLGWRYWKLSFIRSNHIGESGHARVKTLQLHSADHQLILKELVQGRRIWNSLKPCKTALLQSLQLGFDKPIQPWNCIPIIRLKRSPLQRQ